MLAALGALVARLKSEHDYAFEQPEPITPASPAEARESRPTATVATNGTAHVFGRSRWTNIN